MKRLLLTISILLLFASLADAKKIVINKEFNEYVNNKYAGRNNPVGWGSDVPFYRGEKLDVDVELRTDTQNKNDSGDWETSVFLVSKPKWEKGLIQHVFGFLFGWMRHG